MCVMNNICFFSDWWQLFSTGQICGRKWNTSFSNAIWFTINSVWKVRYALVHGQPYVNIYRHMYLNRFLKLFPCYYHVFMYILVFCNICLVFSNIFLYTYLKRILIAKLAEILGIHQANLVFSFFMFLLR